MQENGPLNILNAEINVWRQVSCFQRSTEISAGRIECIQASLMSQNGPLRFLNTELSVWSQVSCRSKVD